MSDFSDPCDAADSEIEARANAAILQAAINVDHMPVGAPGKCRYCGEHFSRIVRGACGRCQDKLNLG